MAPGEKRKLDGGGQEEVAPNKKRKKITFQDVTVFHFKRRQGFVCIPSQGGNTLGMKDSHFSVEVFTMDEFASAKRAELAKAWASSLGESEASDDSEGGVAGGSTVPVPVPHDMEEDPPGLLLQVDSKERRAVLRRAGVHEIDPDEKEQCRSLRGSRQDCGCTCQLYCLPDTCACAIEGIKCQVDRPGFPCACTAEGCQNQAGRLEFNPVKVRTHFVRTIMRTRLENAKYLEPPTSKYLEHPPISKYMEPSSSRYLDPSTSKYLDPSTSKYLDPSSSKYLEPSSSKYLDPSSSSKYLGPTSSMYLEPPSSKYIEAPSTSYIDPSLPPQLPNYIGTYQGPVGGVYSQQGPSHEVPGHLVEEGYYPTEWTGWESPDKWWTVENGEIRSRQDPQYQECPLEPVNTVGEVDSSAAETDGESSSDSGDESGNVEEEVVENNVEYQQQQPEYKGQESEVSEYSNTSYSSEDMAGEFGQDNVYLRQEGEGAQYGKEAQFGREAQFGKEAQFSDDSQYSEQNQFSQDNNVDTNLSDISSILTSSLIESVHA